MKDHIEMSVSEATKLLEESLELLVNIRHLAEFNIKEQCRIKVDVDRFLAGLQRKGIIIINKEKA